MRRPDDVKPDQFALLITFGFVNAGPDRWVRKEDFQGGRLEAVYDTLSALAHARRLASAVKTERPQDAPTRKEQ